MPYVWNLSIFTAQIWNYTQRQQRMVYVALVLALVPLQKCTLQNENGFVLLKAWNTKLNGSTTLKKRVISLFLITNNNWQNLKYLFALFILSMINNIYYASNNLYLACLLHYSLLLFILDLKSCRMVKDKTQNSFLLD